MADDHGPRAALLIMDPSDLRSTLKEYLAHEGFLVLMAAEPEQIFELLERYGASTFSLIVLDEEARERDALLELWNRILDLHSIPVITLSETRKPRLRFATAVLQKPFGLEEWISAIDRACVRRDTSQRLQH